MQQLSGEDCLCLLLATSTRTTTILDMPTSLLRMVHRGRLHHLEYQWRRHRRCQEHHHHQQELLLLLRHRRFPANQLLGGIRQWSHPTITLGSPLYLVQHPDIFPTSQRSKLANARRGRSPGRRRRMPSC